METKERKAEIGLAILMPSEARGKMKTKWPVMDKRTTHAGTFRIVTGGDPLDDDSVLKLAGLYAKEMKSWPNFEAWIVLFEDGKEISREHIKTQEVVS